MQVVDLLFDDQSQPDKKWHFRFAAIVVDAFAGADVRFLDDIGFRNPARQSIVESESNDAFQPISKVRKQVREYVIVPRVQLRNQRLNFR